LRFEERELPTHLSSKKPLPNQSQPVSHPVPGTSERIIITVDGPGGSGKSTVSRIVARRLGIPYLNSGFIYRAVTLLVLEEGGNFDDREKVTRIVRGMNLRFEEDGDLTRVFVHRQNGGGDRDVTSRLKSPDITPQIYKVANDGYYRSLLLELQRHSADVKGVVAEGRDMGTVIFPEANFKFYLDASPEERARRQHRELEASGHAKSYKDILSEVLERDSRDREREHGPLRVPKGALVIQTDAHSIREVVDLVLKKIGLPSEGENGSEKGGGK
jgi:cytidylate kinase